MNAPGVPSLNLMPAARVAHAQRTRRIRSWSVGLVVYACAGAALWTYFATSGDRLATVHGDVVATTAQIASVQAELKIVQAKLLLAKREAEARHEVQHHPDMSVLLRQLAEAAGANITFEKLELKPLPAPAGIVTKPDLAAPWGYTLAVTGIAGSQSEVPRFALALQRLQLFEAVSVQSIKAREAPIIEKEDGTKIVSPLLFNFEIVSTLSDAGAAAAPEPTK